ncbi:MAG: hypothetical protein CVU48_09640 [Candidatus Cloacimonetes bacterium HGW-Cloacimonetes-1]|jgi:hypothetical protein|nr:MAG: hypothetical protein CVU48_09640 [Candidatus Cloacimonetes bacterium HGW-Cloacimonetes-1]
MNFCIRLFDPDQSPQSSTQVPIWTNPIWMKGLAEVHNCRAYHLVCFQNEHVVALMPIYEKTILGLSKCYSPVLGYYQPICFYFDPPKYPNRALLNKLEIKSEIALFLQKRYHRLGINLHFQNHDVRGFTWNKKISAKPLYTFQHELNRDVEIFSEQKTNLRKALRCDYTSGYGFDPERFIDLTIKMFSRKNHPFSIPAARLKKFLILQEQAGNIRQFNLYLENRIVSANLLLCDSTDTVYSILRATEADDLKSGISVLHSHLLVEQLRDQYRLLDWCGANSQGPARFKAALGFDLKVFFHVYF